MLDFADDSPPLALDEPDAPPVFAPRPRRRPRRALLSLTAALVLALSAAGAEANAVSDAHSVAATPMAALAAPAAEGTAGAEPPHSALRSIASAVSAPSRRRRRRRLGVLSGRALAAADVLVRPFSRSPSQRTVAASDGLPSDWADDGQSCSVGCEAPGVIPGWPLKPFHKQHALRNGFNELRNSSFHHCVDIQAVNGAPVYAIASGYAHILVASGSEERVQVGNFIYWHVNLTVSEGQRVTPYRTVLGHIMYGYGHLCFGELGPDGQYLNPLRPGGRALAPWSDTATPVIGRPLVSPGGRASVTVFDPQSFHVRTTYLTPVIAPVALAWRLFGVDGRQVGPLQWALRGTQNYPWSDKNLIYMPSAHAAGFPCFFAKLVCKPDWDYVLAGGLTPTIALPGAGRYRLSVYAWGAGGVPAARDVWLQENPDGTVRELPDR